LDKIITNTNEKEDKGLFILFFTIVNFTIYLLFKSLVMNT